MAVGEVPGRMRQTCLHLVLLEKEGMPATVALGDMDWGCDLNKMITGMPSLTATNKMQ